MVHQCVKGDNVVGKYEISNVSTIDDISISSIPRNVTLSAGGCTLQNISKCTERTTDLKTAKSLNNRILNECYVDLTLDKLRELDNDRYAQNNFIMSRSKFLNEHLINVLVVKLRLKQTDKLEDQDYEYLNSLLNWSRNSIYVMPLLDFESDVDRNTTTPLYLEFVDKMLTEKSSWLNNNTNIGMSIPHFIPRRRINELFQHYTDEYPTFISVDFNNSRMDKPSDITGTILKHFKMEKEEKFFLYGINVKPYKRGPENTSAWDIYMVHGSFNAIGPTHTKPRAMSLPSGWGSMGRMFDSKTVEYRKIDTELRDEFINWMQESYKIPIDEEFERNEGSLYSYLKRYNFQKANNVLIDFSDAIEKHDTDFINEMINHMPDEMKNVNIMNPTRRERRSEKN